MAISLVASAVGRRKGTGARATAVTSLQCKEEKETDEKNESRRVEAQKQGLRLRMRLSVIALFRDLCELDAHLLSLELALVHALQRVGSRIR